MANVYLAGPMRNCLNHNVELFKHWAWKLEEAGFNVESPHVYAFEHNFDVRGTGFEEDDAPRHFDIRAAFAASFEYICLKADALAVLPNWERSDGAHAQVLTAWRMHVPCYSASNLAGFGLESPQLVRRNWQMYRDQGENYCIGCGRFCWLIAYWRCQECYDKWINQWRERTRETHLSR